MITRELDVSLGRLMEQFPDVPPDAVVSMLGDSYELVVEASGLPLTGKAEELTRLRLEVSTRHPARPLPPAGEMH